MRSKLFTLMMASMFLSHCGKENDTDGGTWDEPTKEAKAEEKAEPAQPATANTDAKKDKIPEPPVKSPTETNKANNSTESTKTTTAAPEATQEIRKITDIPMKPGWELSGPDANGREWHMNITNISNKFAIVHIEKGYTEMVASRQLKFSGMKPHARTQAIVIAEFSFFESGIFTNTSINFIRSEVTGECSAVYKVDGTFSSTEVTVYGTCP